VRSVRIGLPAGLGAVRASRAPGSRYHRAIDEPTLFLSSEPHHTKPPSEYEDLRPCVIKSTSAFTGLAFLSRSFTITVRPAFAARGGLRCGSTFLPPDSQHSPRRICDAFLALIREDGLACLPAKCNDASQTCVREIRLLLSESNMARAFESKPKLGTFRLRC
jgi:hypothetical protein